MKYKTVNNGICRDFFRAMARRKFRQCALILHHTAPLLEQSVFDECCRRLCDYYYKLSVEDRVFVYESQFRDSLFELTLFRNFVTYGFEVLQRDFPGSLTHLSFKDTRITYAPFF